MSLRVADVFPAGWRDLFSPDYPRIGVGFDVGTTAKAKSNPSGLVLTQQVGSTYVARLGLKWKTNRPDVAEAIIREALRLPHGLRARKLCIDATSERYFAATLRDSLAGIVPVELVVASETLEIRGEKLTYKAYLGNLLVNTVDDGYFAVPDLPWVEQDFRQVQRDRGSFEAEVDADGNHADLFDAAKLSLHALVGPGGPAKASAAQVGGGRNSNHRPTQRISVRTGRRFT